VTHEEHKKTKTAPTRKRIKKVGSKKKVVVVCKCLMISLLDNIVVTLNSASKATEARSTPSIPSDRVIPPWASLPYEILLNIFHFAASPLLDDDYRVTPAVAWLCKAARTCKAFTEPALTALYECPPLDTPVAAFQLLDLLNTETIYNYRAKIKRLKLDIKNVFAHVAAGRGQFGLAELAILLPKLTAIHLSRSRDRPPFRTAAHSSKQPWYYKPELFSVMSDRGVRLIGWTWIGDLIGQTEGLVQPNMPIHASTLFQGLRHLDLTNLELGGLPVPTQETPGQTAAIRRKGLQPRNADVLEDLSQLTSLTFTSCTSSSWSILDHLPKPLTSLTINHSNIISDTLSNYLQPHGAHLRTLVLNHNDHLSLNFLPHLRSSCPSLTHLSLDLTYYSPLIVASVIAEPVYSTLLDEDHIPTWPTTLQHLSLLHLRKWSTPSALNFFTSLTDAAGELPDLRYLELRAMLPEASWRERASLREKWTDKLERVFLRCSAAPRKELASLKAWREWKEDQDELTAGDNDDAPLAKAIPARKRKLQETIQEDDKVKTRAARKESKRIREEEEEEREESEIAVVHGMCDVVDINIDNLRPSEVRFNEGDFMDSEKSGDEDWNEDDDDLEPPQLRRGRQYAW